MLLLPDIRGVEGFRLSTSTDFQALESDQGDLDRLSEGHLSVDQL